MKQLFFLLGFVCLIAVLLPACAPPPEPEPQAAPEPVFDQAAEEAAIREVAEQMWPTYNAKDLKAFVAFWGEEFESWNGAIKGRVGLEKEILRQFEQSKNGQLKIVGEIGVQFITPDVAIYRFRDESSGFVDESGNPEPPQTRVLAIPFLKKGGKWLAVGFFTRPIEE